MSQNDDSRCTTILLDDRPAAVDRFGPHGRIADAIAAMVAGAPNDKEPGGISIGIEGSWGSGKSTIINLIRKTFDDRSASASHLWQFDTWEHEGDHLRRMFLESLARSLRRKGWITEKQWQDDLDYLARRLKRSTQRDRPKINFFLVALAISVLLVPIGGAFLSNALGGRVVRYTLDPAAWDPRIVIPILLILAPALLLLVIPVRFMFKKEWIPFREFAAPYLTWFLQRSATEIERVITQDPDPTPIEFADTFQRMMREALRPKDRKLVMVIDNLDRIEADNARAIWATLQTFLQSKSEEDWYRRFFVVIPYAPDGISKIWGGGEEEDGKKNRSVVESFLDKSFRVRFQVPITPLTDWKEYLIGDGGLLRTALPDHNVEDFHAVYRLYESIRVRRGDRGAPTPRELVLYVNQIGALHRLWEDKIPLAVIAYYTLLHGEGEKIALELLSGVIPREEELPYLPEDVRDFLAALLYGVEVEKAQVLLLKGPMLRALYDGDAKALGVYEEYYQSSFWDVLESVVYDIAADPSSLNDVARVALTFDQMGVQDEDTTANIRRVLVILRSAARKAIASTPDRSYPLPTIDECDGLLFLATTIQDKQLARSFIGYVGMISFDSDRMFSDPRTPAEQRGEAYVDRLLRLLRGSSRMMLWVDEGEIVVDANDGMYQWVALALRRQDPEQRYWRYFRSRDEAAIFMERITAELTAGTYDKVQQRILPVLGETVRGFEPGMVLMDICFRLAHLDAAATDNWEAMCLPAMLETLFEGMMKVDNPSIIIEPLELTAAVNSIQSLVGRSEYLGTPDLFAAIIGLALQLFTRTDLYQSPDSDHVLAELQRYWEYAESDTINRFIDLILSSEDFAMLWRIVGAVPEARPFARDCFDELLQRERPPFRAIVNTVQLQNYWYLLTDQSEKGEQIGRRLIDRLQESQNLLAVTMPRGFIPRSAGYYRALAETEDGRTSPQFREWCESGATAALQDTSKLAEEDVRQLQLLLDELNKRNDEAKTE